MVPKSKSTYSEVEDREEASLSTRVKVGMESDKRPVGKKRKACSIAPCSNEGAWDPAKILYLHWLNSKTCTGGA